MRQIVESVIRTPGGRLTLRIYDDRLEPVAGQEELELARPVVIRYGEMKAGYGEGLLPSFSELTFSDPTGWLDEVFRGSFYPYDETDFPVTIEGTPGGRPFLWRGIVRQGTRKRPLSRRLSPNLTSLYVFCGLTRLKRAEGVRYFNDRFAQQPMSRTLDAFFGQANPHAKLRVFHDLEGTDGFGAPLGLERLADLQFPGIDFTTGYEALQYLCDQLGARCFMNPADGHFHLTHRAALGERVEAIEVDDYIVDNVSYSTRPVTIEQNIERIEAGRLRAKGGDVLEPLEEAGQIRVDLDEDYNLIADPGFDFSVDDSADPAFLVPLYYETTGVVERAAHPSIDETAGAHLAPDPASGDPDGTVEQTVITITPTQLGGMKAVLVWEAEPLGNTDATLTIELETTNASGTEVVQATGSSASPSAPDAFQAADGTLEGFTLVSSAFFDETTITVRAAGRDAHLKRWRVALLGGGFGFGGQTGRLITTLYVTGASTASSQGNPAQGSPSAGSLPGGLSPVTLDDQRPLYAYIETDDPGDPPVRVGSVAPLKAFRSRRTGYQTTSGLLFRAADRASQQTAAVETLRTVVTGGLYGPGARLLVTKPGETSPSAFVVGPGRKLDLTHYETELADTELPRALTTLAPQP